MRGWRLASDLDLVMAIAMVATLAERGGERYAGGTHGRNG